MRDGVIRVIGMRNIKCKDIIKEYSNIIKSEYDY